MYSLKLIFVLIKHYLSLKFNYSVHIIYYLAYNVTWIFFFYIHEFFYNKIMFDVIEETIK